MEQEEEKNIIIEFQRKVLQEANCTAEMLAYLDEIDEMYSGNTTAYVH